MAATESKTYPITSEQLKSIKFSNIKRGGYDPEEVDIFIHQLATIIIAHLKTYLGNELHQRKEKMPIVPHSVYFQQLSEQLTN